MIGFDYLSTRELLRQDAFCRKECKGSRWVRLVYRVHSREIEGTHQGPLMHCRPAPGSCSEYFRHLQSSVSSPYSSVLFQRTDCQHGFAKPSGGLKMGSLWNKSRLAKSIFALKRRSQKHTRWHLEVVLSLIGINIVHFARVEVFSLSLFGCSRLVSFQYLSLGKVI